MDIGLTAAGAVIGLGAMAMIYALFFMDVSVSTNFGMRVANLDLMSRRQAYVIAGGVLVLVGVVVGFASNRPTSS